MNHLTLQFYHGLFALSFALCRNIKMEYCVTSSQYCLELFTFVLKNFALNSLGPLYQQILLKPPLSLGHTCFNCMSVDILMTLFLCEYPCLRTRSWSSNKFLIKKHDWLTLYFRKQSHCLFRDYCLNEEIDFIKTLWVNLKSLQSFKLLLNVNCKKQL